MVNDQWTHFLSDVIKELKEKYKFKHRLTSPYHPRANGQIEKTNEILYMIITKVIQNSLIDWDSELLDALWTYHIAYIITTKFTSF